MNLDEALGYIKGCAVKMDAIYGEPVFDEWAVLSLLVGHETILAYLGPRPEQFQKHFAIDFTVLRKEILEDRHGVGDFEFARTAQGTHFDAFIVVSDGLYLLCNNTSLSIDKITQNKRWLQAQEPFAMLAEQFRANPLVHDEGVGINKFGP